MLAGRAESGEGGFRVGFELGGVGDDVESAVGQVDAVGGGGFGFEVVDAQEGEEVADGLAWVHAHQGGGAGVEGVGAAFEVACAAA